MVSSGLAGSICGSKPQNLVLQPSLKENPQSRWGFPYPLYPHYPQYLWIICG